MFLGLLARYETLGWYLDPFRGRGSLGVVTRNWQTPYGNAAS